jgi:hypothetical protein
LAPFTDCGASPLGLATSAHNAGHQTPDKMLGKRAFWGYLFYFFCSELKPLPQALMATLCSLEKR